MTDLELARAAAFAGAEVVRSAFGRAQPAEYKAADHPVTEVDLRAEETILSMLREARPDDAILAEEGGRGAESDRRWVVDPLDGTVNFINGIPQVSTSVALYAGDDPLVGVVCDALRGEEFSAAAGEGAWLDGRPMRVTDRTDLGSAIIATGFPYDHKEYATEYGTVVTAILRRVQGIRRFGSAALDLAWVAVGRYDGFWELGLAPWDMAAGLLLVREAGGIVTDPHGVPSHPGLGLIVASNGHLHEELRQIVHHNLPARLADI